MSRKRKRTCDHDDYGILPVPVIPLQQFQRKGPLAKEAVTGPLLPSIYKLAPRLGGERHFKRWRCECLLDSGMVAVNEALEQCQKIIDELKNNGRSVKRVQRSQREMKKLLKLLVKAERKHQEKLDQRSYLYATQTIRSMFVVPPESEPLVFFDE